MGTALTLEQLQLLQRRGARRLLVVFDGDGAGRRATGKLIGGLRSALIGSGLELAVVGLPNGSDPDGLIRNHGPDALIRPIEQARHWLHWELDQLLATLTPTPTTCRCCSAVRLGRESCWPSCHQGLCGSGRSGDSRRPWGWCLSCIMASSPTGPRGLALGGRGSNSPWPAQRLQHHRPMATLHRSSGPNTGPCACSSAAPSAGIPWRCSSSAMTSTAAPSSAWCRSINASAARWPRPGRPIAPISPGDLPAARTPSRPAARKTLQP
jgi:hypothetical protein